jgi:cbb3-type cytochrome oxidase maturation protein
MIVILLLIPLSLLLAAGFLSAFIWAVRSGQYEDTGTPALRVLNDDGTLPSSQDKLMQTEPRRDR